MQTRNRSRARKSLAAALVTSLLLGFSAVTMAQSRTDSRVVEQERHRGIVQLYEALTPLKSVGSFMTVGAHPDDERSSQIALLSRGMGVRSVTVTANRGEGGQNSIGTEYLQALGVLRSSEMEQSSAAFNVELFFLSESFDDPIFDFRFSKSAEETLSIWGEDVMMEKLVRAIRQSRPDILFTNFQDVFGQHGHHRAMAKATVDAFYLAGDPDMYPEHADLGLEPWQPKKLYLPSGTGGGRGDDVEELPVTLTLPTGDFDQLFGATYEQLGQQSRAYHRSQDMGSWRVEGPGNSNLYLLDSHVNTAETDDELFAGLPFTVADLAEGLEDETLAGQLNDIQEAIDAAFEAYPNFADVHEAVADALVATRAAREALADSDLDEDVRSDIDFRLETKEGELQYASQAALSLVTRVVAETPELIRGGSTDVTVTAYLGGQVDADNVELDLVAPDGWTVTASGEAQTETGVARGETISATFTVSAPEDAPFYNPYRRNVHPFRANGDVYGVVRYEADGVPFELTVDSAVIIGVLPDVSLRVTPDNLVLNTLSDTEELIVSVAATSYSTEPASTSVFVDAPDGWIVEPESVDLDFANKGAAAGATFTLTPPEGLLEGSYDFTVRAEGELESTDYVQLIEYEHIGRTYLVTPAVANLQSLQVAFDPNIRVGYVDGGSDLVFEGLRRIGMNVDLMTEDDLTTGDLNSFDTIIVGIYAYRTRPDLLATNARLLNWVENGGNLVVTYHRPADAWDPESVPPEFLDLGRVSILSRVTDAEAPVEFLAPEHQLVTTPNTITEADFDNWVKERGLYFASQWDETYTSLFSITDTQWPDTDEETPFLGSMLTADIGSGRYTYTSLVLHTQIDNNVPGAYRIFANLATPRWAAE